MGEVDESLTLVGFQVTVARCSAPSPPTPTRLQFCLTIAVLGKFESKHFHLQQVKLQHPYLTSNMESKMASEMPRKRILVINPNSSVAMTASLDEMIRDLPTSVEVFLCNAISGPSVSCSYLLAIPPTLGRFFLPHVLGRRRKSSIISSITNSPVT